ncbi:unnamed protein product [Closterium sp. NIES-65]|nr:unnamed protein product [Closterium sp. NIES-65]
MTQGYVPSLPLLPPLPSIQLFRLVEGIDAAAATEAEVRAYEATMLFRLVEGIDAAAAEAEVRAYEANNRDSIAAARAKRVSDSLQGWCRGVESGAAVWREGVRAYEANNRDSIAAARAKRVSDSMQGWCRGVESGAAVKRVVNGVTVWRVLQWYGERRRLKSPPSLQHIASHPLFPPTPSFEAPQKPSLPSAYCISPTLPPYPLSLPSNTFPAYTRQSAEQQS